MPAEPNEEPVAGATVLDEIPGRTLTSLRGCGTTVAAVIPVPEMSGRRLPVLQPSEETVVSPTEVERERS